MEYFVPLTIALSFSGLFFGWLSLAQDDRTDLTSGDKYGGWLSRRRILVQGKPYLTRTYLLPANSVFNAYLHEWHASDDYESALHDHPWGSCSVLLKGEIREHFDRDGTVLARRVSRLRPVFRGAKFRHAIEIPPDQPRPPLTLFLTGPALRTWFFYCRQRFGRKVHWRDFQGRDGGNCAG